MLLDTVISWLSAINILRVAIVLLCIQLLRNKYGYGLSAIPGPYLASFTNLHRFFLVYGRKPEQEHIRLHKELGDVVRLGPNSVSTTNLQAVKEIYGLNKGYNKTDFYPVQQTIAGGERVHGLFNTTNESFHAKLRRNVANAYAMSNLLQFEPLVDSTTTAFLKAMDERYANSGWVCDFGQWLQWYAFDVIGELTLSQRLGFIDQAKDVEGIIENLETFLNYVAPIGQMPWLDSIFKKNPIRLWLSKKGIIGSTSAVVTFTQMQMATRLAESKANAADRRDFLSRFIAAGEQNPEFMTPSRVLSVTLSNMSAGSDTTAISLRAAFYHLLKNPACLEKLLNELQSLPINDTTLISFTTAKTLPYLNAVIKEALRIHPAVGLTLERIVPAAGLQIGSHFLPPGTIVGTSAWALHQDEKIFGKDTAAFRPERWIDTSEESKAVMNSALFAFGMGSRTCIGKNISLLEMYKVVPAVLMKFQIELQYPDREWKTHNAWFVKQTGLFVTLAKKV